MAQEQEQQLAALIADQAAAQARVAEIQSMVHHLHAEQARKEVSVAQAQLNLERCKIFAPVAGIVMRVYAEPGRKQMLGSDSMTSTTVASIYQPSALQVRVDVALADAGRLRLGMPARIRCDAWPEKVFHGAIEKIEGHADLTRNTLQVKVGIEDPHHLMRPEMLSRVQFSVPQRATNRRTTNP